MNAQLQVDENEESLMGLIFFYHQSEALGPGLWWIKQHGGSCQ